MWLLFVRRLRRRVEDVTGELDFASHNLDPERATLLEALERYHSHEGETIRRLVDHDQRLRDHHAVALRSARSGNAILEEMLVAEKSQTLS